MRMTRLYWLFRYFLNLGASHVFLSSPVSLLVAGGIARLSLQPYGLVGCLDGRVVDCRGDQLSIDVVVP